MDVAIVGAGVMGAMLADRLAGSGARVALFDRRPPAAGSTAASTALVMWGMDVPLTHLARDIGAEEAARRWRRVYQAVQRLARHVDEGGLDARRIDRPELYLAGTLLDVEALAAEGAARQAAGLPSTFLDAADVGRRFDIAPRAALLSGGACEVDPVRLTHALLQRAIAAGATITWPSNVIGLDEDAQRVRLYLEDGGRVSADHVVIAGGYERALALLPDDFELLSSFAIATPPGTAPLWRENALIWEASDPYLYTRATADGRVIAGGGDEETTDPQARDALMDAKTRMLRRRLGELADTPEPVVDCAWSALFGTSPDGLPAVGRAQGQARTWLASGFGGNGVSFAALAAELIAAELEGTPDRDAACFDPYRFQDLSRR
ncbi:NAD(P)/FAD-dependent oxidoreductase [Zavarzinia sp. CC-PAN008]|uniref:NAD(P)/FAD-dependent oxidoreductase n=1 Tax=Zavarzinia sp. CC-PAN008 TaxID=3243332 RepID=UPI003F746F32